MGAKRIEAPSLAWARSPPMVRPRDIVTRPRRTAAWLVREARWARAFVSSIEKRELPALPPATTEATDRLHARLDADDIAEIQARVRGEDAERWAQTALQDRRRLALAYGLAYGVAGIAEKTGLSDVEPPESVHAMARGPAATGGSYFYADIVIDALRGAGARLGDGARGLDFGCSSGRVVRVLAAAFPEIEWHACDPQPSPIHWGQQNIPGVEFSVSPQEPPLRFDAGTFDFVFAISIWTHYGEHAARRWFSEMHRLIRPGGLLILTLHGFTSIAYYVGQDRRQRRDAIKIAGDLYRRGYWFAREWTSEEGDHGIRSPEWGSTFLTTEWLLNEVTPSWAVVGFGAGRAEGNQDVIVLERRA
jgi:SAM-dependent methyltransferase